MRGVRAALVVMRGKDLERRIELQQLAEETVVSCSGSPVGRSVRPVAPISSVSPVKTRSSTTRHIESRGMAGRVDGVKAQIADREHLAVVEPKPGERRRALRDASPRARERLAQLLGRREMIGMRMRVDDIVDAHARLASPSPDSARSGGFPGRSARRRRYRCSRPDRIGSRPWRLARKSSKNPSRHPRRR